MHHVMSSTMTPLARSSSKTRGLDRSSSNLKSPHQLAQSSSAASLINYRINQSISGKGLGSQSKLRLDKENEVQKKSRDMSADSLQKRLDSFFASTRNFIYSATKMKTSMVEALKDVDQQIDFNIKLFETDKQSLERCLTTLESQLFNLKDQPDLHQRNTLSNFNQSRTALIHRSQDQFAQTQNLTETNYLHQLRRENRNLKYEMLNLKEEIDKIHIEKHATFKSQDQVIVSELEALQKQVSKIEKKAQERKVCIKKLYSLLENKDKELEEFKKYQQRYPLGAVINMVSQLKKFDSSKKMISYIEMAVKEVKLNSLLQKEGDTLSKQKKIEIEEMIHFLQVEEKEIIKHFAISQQPNVHSTQKQERYTSPKPHSLIQNYTSNGFSSPVNQVLDQQPSNGVLSPTQFIRSNGFQNPQQISRDGSAIGSPSNSKNQFTSSQQFFNKSINSQQRISVTSPTTKAMNASLGAGFSRDDFEYVLKEQVEYVRKKFLTHFVEMLAQLNIQVDNQNDEATIVLRLRDEFSKIATKHTGYQQLVQELRQRIEQKEQEVKEKQVQIDNQQVQALKIQEQIENNPKITKLEEQVQQFKSEVRQRNEEKKQIQMKINQLEDVKVEQERREKLYLEDIDRLKDELFMVLDNLKSILEYHGLISQNDEKNVEHMMDSLREHFNKQEDKVYLHKNVFEDMEKKIIEHSEEVEKLQYQNSELVKQIDDLDEINNTLKNQLEIQQLKNQEGENLETGIRNKIIQLQNENHILKKNQIEPEALEKLQQEIRDAQNELRERNDVIINMKTEISSLESQLQEKDKQIKKVNAELAETDSEKNHQTKLVKSLEQFQVDKKARNEEIMEKVIEMEKIQKKLNRRNNELEEEIKRYKEMEIKLEVKAEKNKKQGDEKSQDLLKKVKELEKTLQISNQKITEQKETIISLQSQISNLQKDVSQSQENNSKNETDLKKQNDIQLAQLEFAQQKQIQQLREEMDNIINEERSKYEKEIQAIRRQDESEEYINQEKYQEILSELDNKNEQIVSLQKQLSDMQRAIENSRKEINEERQKWQEETQEELRKHGVEAEKQIELEKQQIVLQFEKLISERASQFNSEKAQYTAVFEKELKQLESKHKEQQEEINRESKRVVELNAMELNGLRESNEEYKEALERIQMELKQTITRENFSKEEIENLKTKIELIESNASSENQSVVNGLQMEKRQLESNVTLLKRNAEQSEQNTLELQQKIQKLKDENESISIERSNLIRQIQTIQEETEHSKQEDNQKLQEIQSHNQQKDLSIQQLENDLTNQKQKIDQLNKEINIINQDKIQLNHKISELQQQIQQKEKVAEQTQKNTEETIAQLKKDHQTKLEEVIHQSKGEIVESFKQQRLSLEQQINVLHQQNEQLNKHIESQTQSNQQQQLQQQTEFQNKQQQLQLQFEQQNTQLKLSYEEQKQQLVSQLEKQIATLNEQNIQNKKNHDAELSSQNKESAVKIENALNQGRNEATSTYKPQIANLEQEIKQLNTKISDLTMNANNLQQQLDSSALKYEDTITQLKRDHQSKLEDSVKKARAETSEGYKQQITTLERQISVIQENSNVNAQSQTSKLTQEITSLNQQIIALQSDNSSLIQHNSESESQIEKLMKDISEYQAKISHLEQGNANLQSKLQDSEQKNQQLQDQQKKKELTLSSQQNQEYERLSGENTLLGNQIVELKQQIETYQIQLQQAASQKQESGRIGQLQKENQDLLEQNNFLISQINSLNIQVQNLEDQLQNVPQITNQHEIQHEEVYVQKVKEEGEQVEEIFDFEDFADELAASQLTKDKPRNDREKKAEMGALPAGSGQFKLNFNSLQNNIDDDAERMHIRRDLGENQSAHASASNNNQDPDLDDFDDSPHEKSHLKDEIIQEYGKEIEGQKSEIQDLKQQIDLMFQDINEQRNYIQYLEGLVEEKSREQQEPQTSQPQMVPEKLKEIQAKQVDEGAASPNTKILNLKTKLADVQENHETETMNLNDQIIQLKEENRAIKAQLTEFIQLNEDLEFRIEEKDNQILDLQDNQHEDGAEEKMGLLQEQNDKLKQKVRRYEEDIAYLQQVNQNFNKQIDEYQKKLKLKQPNTGSESGQSKEDDDYEGGLVNLVKELGKTQQQQQQQQQASQQQITQPQLKQPEISKKESQMQQIGSYNEMQDQDFENDQDEEDIYSQQKPKMMNTEEAEQYEARLINEKIQLQQQIAELKNDYGTIQTEDQIQIQELQKKLDQNKKQFLLLQERNSNRNKEKYENAQLKQKNLHLQQQYKEVKEERERLNIENQALKSQMVSLNASPQNNSSKKGHLSNNSITLTEQIDMLKLSLADAQSQLKSMKVKYQQGLKKIKSAIEAPSFSATQPADTEEDIVALADQLVSNHQQRLQQLQIQLHQTLSEQQSSQKSPVGILNVDEVNTDEGDKKATDYTSLKAFILYSAKLEAILEEVLLNKVLQANEQQYRRDLTSEQYEKIQKYLRILNDYQLCLQEKEKEYNEMTDKVTLLLEENEKLKRSESTSNFLSRKSKPQQDPFQINDFENIKEEIPNPVNDQNNESSFISMSEQIIKELEGANTKTPQNQISMQQQSQIEKQQQEDLNKLVKENSELKASKDYYATRQDELYDELRAKDEIIQNNENYVKSLKKEIRKIKESTEAVSQKEQLKTIFIKFIETLADKKKQLEADNFLGILFSMLGITDNDKDEIINTLAKKAADKKKTITQLLVQK